MDNEPQTEQKVLAWHFTSDTLRDGRPVPAVGVTLTHKGPVAQCESGLHASKNLVDCIGYAPYGSTLLHRVELWGDVNEGNDKLVARNRRIIATIPATDFLREFAREVALEALLSYFPAPADDTEAFEDYAHVLTYLASGASELRPEAESAGWRLRDHAWADYRADAADAADAAAAAARAAAADAAADAAAAAAARAAAARAAAADADAAAARAAAADAAADADAARAAARAAAADAAADADAARAAAADAAADADAADDADAAGLERYSEAWWTVYNKAYAEAYEQHVKPARVFMEKLAERLLEQAQKAARRHA
jgi:hypothetical protein